MSDVRIKCCGMFRPEDIQAVNAALPDFCGFVVNVPASHRSVTSEQVLELRAELRGDIEAVGVFVDEDPAVIGRLVDDGGIDVVQLHGHEDAEYLKRLRMYCDAPVIQAFKVRTPQDVECALQSEAELVLLDNGAGTGESFDWRLLSGIERPFILAGGLTPENLPQAIGQVKPWGVDLSSGLEVDGRKDADRIAAAVAAVRGVKG